MEKTILVLDQRDMEPPTTVERRGDYFVRIAVRAVLRDQNGCIALMYAKRGSYYKLPGGGVMDDENLNQALHRELLEETGSRVVIGEKLGTVEEWRDFEAMRQISHAYAATLIDEPDTPSFTQSEIDEGFEPIWTKNLEEAIRLVESNNSDDKMGIEFMSKRDVAILRSAR